MKQLIIIRIRSFWVIKHRADTSKNQHMFVYFYDLYIHICGVYGHICVYTIDIYIDVGVEMCLFVCTYAVFAFMQLSRLRLEY